MGIGEQATTDGMLGCARYMSLGRASAASRSMSFGLSGNVHTLHMYLQTRTLEKLAGGQGTSAPTPGM